jgi:RNA polymerase sigma-B factor
VVLVEGALDLASQPRLAAVLAGRLTAGRVNLIVDLAGVSLLDAGTVNLLSRTAYLAHRQGGTVHAIGACGLVQEVLGIAGVDKWLHAFDEPAELIDAYGPADDLPEVAEPGGEMAQRWPGSRDITTHGLLAGMAEVEPGSPEWTELRAQVIEDNMGFAVRLVRRFRDRGEPMEDLNQVALVGLVNAVDGFDPGRGCEFVGYATPTIVGEVRRYFRDKGWRIKVPRRLQELRLRVNRARMELSQTLGASPSNADIGSYLGVEEGEVAEAVEVSRLYHPVSLSAPTSADGEVAVADWFGADDPGIEAVDNRVSVAPLLAGLPDREKKILTMRFFASMTQSQIAAELGISQMHVSRLLAQTLEQLRSALAAA